MNNITKKKATCQCGHEHDSRAEAVRCNELNKLLADGLIDELRYQVAFELVPKFSKRGEMSGEQKISYIADFVYYEGCALIVEDLKSSWTAKDGVYRLKKKLFKHRYCREGSNIIFREVIK